MEQVALGVNSNIQVVIVAGLFDAANGIYSFNYPIYINFVPDVIKLKHYSVIIGADSDLTVFKISSNLVNGGILSFPFAHIKVYDGTDLSTIQQAMISQNCDISFLNKAKKFINGNYPFQISTATDTIPGNASIQVALTFEFIKF